MILKKLKEKYNQLIDFIEDVERTRAILLVPKGMLMSPYAQDLVNEKYDARNACHEAESGFVDLKNFIDNLGAEIKKDMDDLSNFSKNDEVERQIRFDYIQNLAIVLSYIQTIQRRAEIIESGVTDFYDDNGNVDIDSLAEKFKQKVEA